MHLGGKILPHTWQVCFTSGLLQRKAYRKLRWWNFYKRRVVFFHRTAWKAERDEMGFCAFKVNSVLELFHLCWKVVFRLVCVRL